ncbi:cathepsin O-like [Euwallacea fornicatus]|uniref:cathepsin O-like n=1 Tax=Euwallacea fornicatus TaxID=995702 RepID=UPI00339064C1
MPIDYKTYLEVGCYVALLFFIIPIYYPNNPNIEEAFQEYLVKYNKSYPDKTIYKHRLDAFKKSLGLIDLLNVNKTNNNSAKYGLTKFSDLTPEEFMLFQNNRHLSVSKYVKRNNVDEFFWDDSIPKIVDWREAGIVTKVKQQENCGACWAFAVTECLESMQAIKDKKLVELSVQQMIDCSTYNRGCEGGDICSLLQWLKDYNVTVANETDYPLKLKDQKCQRRDIKGGVQVKDYVCKNFVGRESVILKLLATNGPVAVGVNGQTWQNYVGGIIQFHCDDNLSHAVQIVGYNLTADIPYYIVRNSWGEDFGDNGYLYIAIGSNMCGVGYEVAALTLI